MEIYFTSDTHFCHNQGFLYEPRNFSNINEMNEAIVENWNSIVKPNDIVYHLGDIMLNDNTTAMEYIKQLNGQIFMIWGNHDTDARKELLVRLPHFNGGLYAHIIKYEKFSIYMSHYPTLTANYDDKHFNQHVINLHGHTHQKQNWLTPENPFMYHVGVDSHDCKPVHIDEIITDIRNRWTALGGLKMEKRPLYDYPM